MSDKDKPSHPFVAPKPGDFEGRIGVGFGEPKDSRNVSNPYDTPDRPVRPTPTPPTTPNPPRPIEPSPPARPTPPVVPPTPPPAPIRPATSPNPILPDPAPIPGFHVGQKVRHRTDSVHQIHKVLTLPTPPTQGNVGDPRMQIRRELEPNDIQLVDSALYESAEGPGPEVKPPTR